MAKKLNILNIGHTPPRLGGSAFANIETLIALSEKGHKVNCITHLAPNHLSQENYNSSWKDTNVNVHPIELEFIPAAKPPSAEHMKKKKKLILDKFYTLVKKESPDVIMIGHESYSFYANEEARKLGIPVVQMLHGTPTHGIDNGIYPKDLTNQFLESLDQATLIVGVSKYLSKILNNHGITQTSYIYNGTDTDVFKPAEKKDEAFLKSLGIKLSNKVVMHASNLKPVKRPLDIVESAQYAIKEDPSIVYVIVGDGPLKEPMESRAKELKIYDNFRFVKKIPFSEMPKYFQNADLFLLPSENEGFGRVIREAQACENVPLASNIGPLPEVIEDRMSGRLFEKGNVKDLAYKILETTADKINHTRIKKNARNVAVNYNIHRMIEDYELALTDPLNFLAYKPI